MDIQETVKTMRSLRMESIRRPVTHWNQTRIYLRPPTIEAVNGALSASLVEQEQWGKNGPATLTAPGDGWKIGRAWEELRKGLGFQ
jgi:hypothetical protein